MAENTWTLNDGVPATLSQTFEAPAAENSWSLYDSCPAVLAMLFANLAAEWTNHDWLVGLGMVQAAQAGGEQALLEGAVSCSCVAAGELTTQITLVGATSGSVVAAGQLTTAIMLAGAAQASATASANLTTEIRLSGTAQGSAVAAGALMTEIRMEGAAVCSATASADLTAPQPILLEGSAECSAIAAGVLTTVITLSGAADCSIIAQGALTIPSAAELEGSALCTATASGDLWTKTEEIIQGYWYECSPQKRQGALLRGSARCECFARGELTILDCTDDDLVMSLMMAAWDEEEDLVEANKRNSPGIYFLAEMIHRREEREGRKVRGQERRKYEEVQRVQLR